MTDSSHRPHKETGSLLLVCDTGGPISCSKGSFPSQLLFLQALFCQVPSNHVLNMYDVTNIWHVPLVLEAQGAHRSICAALQLGGAENMNLGFWKQSLAERWDNLVAVVSRCLCIRLASARERPTSLWGHYARCSTPAVLESLFSDRVTIL